MASSSPFHSPLWKSDRLRSGFILNLDVLLDPKKDVPHLGDFVLHQELVQRVGDLQPTDEYCDNYILIAVIYQDHLTLKVIDIVLEALSRLHLDRKEVIVVLLKLTPRSILIVEDLPHLFEVSE